jgi:hypothetical protein
MLSHFKNLIIRDLQALRLEVSSFTEDSFIWNKLPGTVNSAGHLTLHLVGNLNHFIGAGLGKTGYIRNRENEFTCAPVSKTELLKEVDECISTIEISFAQISDGDLQKDFPLSWREGLFYNTNFMLVQLTAHLNYHLGQVNYLRRYFNA